METKREIRKRIRGYRSLLSGMERRNYSIRIQDQLLTHPLYLSADEIYCYVAFGDEVETTRIMDNSWKMGKKLAVPRIHVDNSTQTMDFYYIDSMDELKEGYFGILEPVTSKRADGENVLVIMPGVAFDSHCNRIGYGKGFYDSYLSRNPGYRRIALAYAIQCVQSIPACEFDICPEFIITEKEMYSC